MKRELIYPLAGFIIFIALSIIIYFYYKPVPKKVLNIGKVPVNIEAFKQNKSPETRRISRFIYFQVIEKGFGALLRQFGNERITIKTPLYKGVSLIPKNRILISEFYKNYKELGITFLKSAITTKDLDILILFEIYPTNADHVEVNFIVYDAINNIIRNHKIPLRKSELLDRREYLDQLISKFLSEDVKRIMEGLS